MQRDAKDFSLLPLRKVHGCWQLVVIYVGFPRFFGFKQWSLKLLMTQNITKISRSNPQRQRQVSYECYESQWAILLKSVWIDIKFHRMAVHSSLVWVDAFCSHSLSVWVCACSASRWGPRETQKKRESQSLGPSNKQPSWNNESVPINPKWSSSSDSAWSWQQHFWSPGNLSRWRLQEQTSSDLLYLIEMVNLWAGSTSIILDVEESLCCLEHRINWFKWNPIFKKLTQARRLKWLTRTNRSDQ